MKNKYLQICLIISISTCFGSSIANASTYPEGTRTASKAWLDSTNECVLDTRDRNIMYENSSNCQRSIALMHMYLDTYTGFRNPDLIAENNANAAKSYLWMAMALSLGKKSGTPVYNIDVW